MVSWRLPSSQVALRGMEMQCSLFFLPLRKSWGCSLSPWESVGCQGKMLTANAVITWVTAVNANWIEWGHGLQSCQYFSRNIAASAHPAHAFLKVRGLWTYHAHTGGRGCCPWLPLACELWPRFSHFLLSLSDLCSQTITDLMQH